MEKIKAAGGAVGVAPIWELFAMTIFMFTPGILIFRFGNPALAGLFWGVAPIVPIAVAGRQKAGHLNTVVTIGAYFAKQVSGVTAFFMVLAQLAGGVAGIMLASLFANNEFSREFAWNYIARPEAGFETMLFSLKTLELIIREGFPLFVIALLALAIGKKKKSWTEWLVIGGLIGTVLGFFVWLNGPVTGGAINSSRASAPWLLVWPGRGLDTLFIIQILPSFIVGPLAGLLYKTRVDE